MESTARLIVLDRDGVINHDRDDYVKTPQEWVPINGSIEAIAQLYHAGWRIVIASNQSVIGRGLLTLEGLCQIHLKMQKILAGINAQVDGLFFCPHVPEARCACRKPEPGLLAQIERRFRPRWQETCFVGDTTKDIDAARAIGAQPILTLTGQGERTLQVAEGIADVSVYPDLAAVAADLITAADATSHVLGAGSAAAER